ncbi:MAG: hypothetical protein WD826_01890, partial [Actinomycetota bacterium]
MRNMKILFAVLAVLLLSAACAQGDDPTVEPPEDGELSIQFADSIPETIEGNVLPLPVTYSGIEIVAADGDTSGDTGHFHIFIDSDPVEEG